MSKHKASVQCGFWEKLYKSRPLRSPGSGRWVGPRDLGVEWGIYMGMSSIKWTGNMEPNKARCALQTLTNKSLYESHRQWTDWTGRMISHPSHLTQDYKKWARVPKQDRQGGYRAVTRVVKTEVASRGRCRYRTRSGQTRHIRLRWSSRNTFFSRFFWPDLCLTVKWGKSFLCVVYTMRFALSRANTFPCGHVSVRLNILLPVAHSGITPHSFPVYFSSFLLSDISGLCGEWKGLAVWLTGADCV